MRNRCRRRVANNEPRINHRHTRCNIRFLPLLYAARLQRYLYPAVKNYRHRQFLNLVRLFGQTFSLVPRGITMLLGISQFAET